MKKLIAFVSLQVAAIFVRWALSEHGGEAAKGWSYTLHFIAIAAWGWALMRDWQEESARRAAHIEFLKEVKTILEEPLSETAPEPTPQEAFHRDVCAVAYGELDEAEFERRWAGRVPPSPRPPRRKDRTVELFKEIMTDPKYAPDTSFRDKVRAEIVKELERPQARAWACRVTLGIHENGPCTCVEVHEHADPAFRKGQYVRLRGAPEKLWLVTAVTPCHGPEGAFWWGYYVDDAGGRSLHPWESELTLALPHSGEVWEKRLCDRHPDPYSGCGRSMMVSERFDWFLHLDRADNVSCGCLVPVHFGMGAPQSPKKTGA